MAMYDALLEKGEILDEDSGKIVMKSPGEVHWNIPKYLFRLSKDLYFTFKSSSFLFMDREWCFILSAVSYEDSDCLSIGLRSVHHETNTTIIFRVGIKANDGSELSRLLEHEFEYEHDIAFAHFAVDIINPYFTRQLVSGGKITFFCSFLSSCRESETSENRPSKVKDVATETADADFRNSQNKFEDDRDASKELKGGDKLIENFEELFLSGDHHDIIIKVKDQEIRAHKLIIVVRSPVFAAMFHHDTIEKNTRDITIDDYDPEAFREFLYFLYSGKLENVSAANVIELYVIADKYQVDEVKSVCLEFMMRNMLDETFCDFISLALRHNERDLLNVATNYFVKNVKTIIVTVKWQSFHKEYPVESNELYIKAISHLIPD